MIELEGEANSRKNITDALRVAIMRIAHMTVSLFVVVVKLGRIQSLSCSFTTFRAL
jgi:hypothetical protein